MGTSMNFKGFGNDGNFSLARQPSVYSLTFDEFQSTLGKDFGSMNMEELLKNIWSAEETQNIASAPANTSVGNSSNGVQDWGNQGGFLQRQGSLTLPRTLSLKTVDEVWKDIAKDYTSRKDSRVAEQTVTQAHREPTLGEITLEEFLVRAGVVREDKPNPSGFLGELAQPNANKGFGINFQQPNNGATGLMGSRIADNNSQISLQPSILPLNVNGVRSTQPQVIAPLNPQQPMFPRQSAVSCAPSMTIPSSTRQLGSPGIKGGIFGGLVDPKINDNLANGTAIHGGCGGGVGIVGYGGEGSKSPTSLSSDELKSSDDAPSVSPVPYMFNGDLRGRRSNNTVEKSIERRHKRMIKNRESAARSRARKQAYTMELEQEVAKLKEENQELRKKQAEFLEMQKNQMMEMMKAQQGAKKRRLMRTLTGPW
ncbi:hypothetical protein V2J09_007523 [Rumex salicifolius]